MDLRLSDDDGAFQGEVRRFIDDNLPADIRDKVENGLNLEKADFVTWQKILHAQGWVAPNWPTEYGGPGWTPIQRFLFDEELARASTPPIIPFGLGMVGPVIMAFGNDEQKKHHLPRILATDDWWCQGYSEPGAGSDLASLKTRAVADGDDYIVSGAKTWTTMAQWADMMFCLVRTSDEGKRQDGISFILLDMKSDGVSVNPIQTMDGGFEVNEVFLDDVRVPRANLIGEENKGWTYAKFLLGHERTGIAEVGASKQRLRKLKEIASAETAGTQSLMDDSDFAGKVADAEISLTALEYLNLRFLAEVAAGREIGAEASMLKIRGTEIRQQLTELTIEALGYYQMPFELEQLTDRWNEPAIGPDYAAAQMPQYLFSRAATIYGGTNEIQRNIIAKMVLGL